MSYPYSYHNDPALPANVMTPTTPGASSTASTPMAYPWEYDVAAGAAPPNPGMSLVPAEFPSQAPHELYTPQEAPAPQPQPQPQVNAPTIIQLEERRPLVPSQMRSRNRPQGVSGESRTRPHVEMSGASGSRPSSSSGFSPSGLLRVEPTHVHAERDRAHPYRRPHSPEDIISRASSAGTGRGATRRGSEQPPMRFSSHELGESSGAMQAGSSGAAVGGGSGATPGFSRMSPPMIVPSMAPPPTVPSSISPLQRLHASTAMIQTKTFSIRTDVHFSSISNTMTALLELPGVKKTDLNVNLVIDSFTKVKQVVVSGKTTTSFAEYGQEERDGHSKITRERKFGDFIRRLNVPFETKANDVHADLQDGILTLRVPLGPPLPADPPQAILIQ